MLYNRVRKEEKTMEKAKLVKLYRELYNYYNELDPEDNVNRPHRARQVMWDIEDILIDNKLMTSSELRFLRGKYGNI